MLFVFIDSFFINGDDIFYNEIKTRINETSIRLDR